MQETEYLCFVDESYSDDNQRFKSITVVSFLKNFETRFKTKFSEKKITEKYSNEFKWSLPRSREYQEFATDLIDLVFECLGEIRIDSLMWDVEDSRHDIPDRDDNANFGRMYYALLINVLYRRGKGLNYTIFADNNNLLQKDILQQCLCHKGEKLFYDPTLFDGEVNQNYYIDNIQYVDSKKFFCIQIADLFGGLFVFSKIFYEEYIQYQNRNNPTLFDISNGSRIGRTEKKRFIILEHFLKKKKQNSLSIKYESSLNRALETCNPKTTSLNFWSYKPQGDYDRAPQRNNQQAFRRVFRGK